MRRYLASLAARILARQPRRHRVSVKERARQLRRELGLPEHPGLAA